MSNFQFTPYYSYGIGEQPFVTWTGGFTDSELDEIIAIGNKLDLTDGLVGQGNDVSEKIRISKVSWLRYEHCEWLYHRLADITQQLNGQFYRYDLHGFSEDMQYTTYNESDQGFYTWHQDSMSGSNVEGFDSRLPRKFSLSLQLSDPSEYDGGDLEMKTGDDTMTLPKERGTVIGFPSFMLHRVTPVTRGIRRSLVVWVTGPSFR